MVRVFTDERCLAHAVGHGYPESPERLTSVVAALRRAAWQLEEGGAVPPDLEESVLAVHAESYVRRFERAAARGDGFLDSADNPLSPGVWSAAWAAAGATAAALDWVVAAPDRQAFAAVRPPGHHAERDHAMGFCFFGNVAVAAERARRRHGLSRVAIVDFDVHHGNGTQHLFEARNDVFFASTHQSPFYPGSGAANETGRGPGLGFTLNLPLSAGAGDTELERAIGEQVVPALRRFGPELLVLSAGFDAWRDDPIGGLEVTVEGFASISRILAAAAHELCHGRLLSVLEGGYDLSALPHLVETHLLGLSSVPH